MLCKRELSYDIDDNDDDDDEKQGTQLLCFVRERERELFDQPETRPTVGNQPSKDYLDGDDEHCNY